jgi:hypothetical protein
VQDEGGPADTDWGVEGVPEAVESPAKVQAKQLVLLELYAAKRNSLDKVVLQEDIQAAIKKVSSLGVGNPANFLKDIVRRHTANQQWPDVLKAERITARQRFGQKRVFEFVPYAEGYDEPFPDRFVHGPDTPVFAIQSVSIPAAARRLGRRDETWLTQVVVGLRILESQLAFCSAEYVGRIRDMVHLQVGMKTQPEIDATYLLTVAPEGKAGQEEHVFVTCEVKGMNERLLEDQIRLQVHQAFKTTMKLKEPRIDAVKPMAVQIVEQSGTGGAERLIYVVAFKSVDRQQYDALWRRGEETLSLKDTTPVYDLPLELDSSALFSVRPTVQGVSAPIRKNGRQS